LVNINCVGELVQFRSCHFELVETGHNFYAKIIVENIALLPVQVDSYFMSKEKKHNTKHELFEMIKSADSQTGFYAEIQNAHLIVSRVLLDQLSRSAITLQTKQRNYNNNQNRYKADVKFMDNDLGCEKKRGNILQQSRFSSIVFSAVLSNPNRSSSIYIVFCWAPCLLILISPALFLNLSHPKAGSTHTKNLCEIMSATHLSEPKPVCTLISAHFMSATFYVLPALAIVGITWSLRI
jgi:hypothetical protein